MAVPPRPAVHRGPMHPAAEAETRTGPVRGLPGVPASYGRVNRGARSVNPFVNELQRDGRHAATCSHDPARRAGRYLLSRLAPAGDPRSEPQMAQTQSEPATAVADGPLTEAEVAGLDAWWRAAN